MSNYYTLAVTLCNGEVLKYKNLTPDQIKEAQEKIWTQGIKKKINHTTTELLSPFLIKSAIVMEQMAYLNE